MHKKPYNFKCLAIAAQKSIESLAALRQVAKHRADSDQGITQQDESLDSSLTNSTCGESLGNISQRGGDV
jgi:hypothetical protein